MERCSRSLSAELAAVEPSRTECCSWACAVVWHVVGFLLITFLRKKTEALLWRVDFYIYWGTCWHVSSVVHKMLDWNLRCIISSDISTLAHSCGVAWQSHGAFILSKLHCNLYMLCVYLNFCLFSRPAHACSDDLSSSYLWKKVNVGDKDPVQKRVQWTVGVFVKELKEEVCWRRSDCMTTVLKRVFELHSISIIFNLYSLCSGKLALGCV